jgi:hypothetical protein
VTRVPATRTLENSLRRAGFVYVGGSDEVGRGCLAGPVVAGAVVLHPDRHIPGVCDSKAVPAAERERLYEQILKHAVSWAVAAADPTEIDRINIHQASLRAMQRAILMLAPLPDIVLVDAFRVPDLPMGAAWCAARRSAMFRDRRGLDRRESDAAIGLMFELHAATRATASIATRVTRPPIISTPLHGLATPMHTVARFVRRRCSTESPSS